MKAGEVFPILIKKQKSRKCHPFNIKVNIDLDSKQIKRQRRANKDDASTAVGTKYINLRSLC